MTLWVNQITKMICSGPHLGLTPLLAGNGPIVSWDGDEALLFTDLATLHLCLGFLSHNKDNKENFQVGWSVMSHRNTLGMGSPLCAGP